MKKYIQKKWQCMAIIFNSSYVSILSTIECIILKLPQRIFYGCNGLVSDFKLTHCIFHATRKVSMTKLRHSTGEMRCGDLGVWRMWSIELMLWLLWPNQSSRDVNVAIMVLTTSLVPPPAPDHLSVAGLHHLNGNHLSHSFSWPPTSHFQGSSGQC